MRLIKRGAEGDLYETTWNGKKSVLKIRKKKDYRNPELDARIRRQRTIREAEIIRQVKSFGIAAPVIFLADAVQCRIMMQLIRGRPANCISGKRLVGLCRDFGGIVGRLHENGIMHGDLTTSNFIISAKRTFIIDFGLAMRTSKPEDHAVDLRLFKEILNSAHVGEMRGAWRNFLAGYKSAVGQDRHDTVTGLVAVIEGRGRYATVV